MATQTQMQTMTIDKQDIPFIHEESKLLPIVSLQLIFSGHGSIADGKKAGLAKITSAMLNEGTKELGATAFAKLLDAKAIEVYSSNGRETFVLNVDCLKSEFELAMHYLAMLLNSPNFTQETLDKVKTKMIGALKQKEGDFDYLASVSLMSTLFKNTPIASPNSGTPESIASINLDDVKAFLQASLSLANCMVVIGGDITLKSAEQLTRKILMTLPVGSKAESPYFYANNKQEEITQHKPSEQAYIYFGAPINATISDEDSYKAKVAAFILGSSGFGSRLMEEVRVKRGLAYSAYGRINFAKSHSYFSGHLQTKLESAKEAQKVVVEVIEDFIKNGVNEKELISAKKFLLGSEPLRTETLSQRLGRSFQEIYNGKKLGSSVDDLKSIDALSLEDLNSYIEAHSEIKEVSFSFVTK
jgi:predicted Zn-dependent peptidase